MTGTGDNQERVIGPLGSIAVVAGSMLGVGIFLIPPVVARSVETETGFLLVWLVGGLMALCGTVAYAELGAMFPKAGGDYVFLREAWDESVSFAGGWVMFLGIFGGSLATMSVAVCTYQFNAILEYFLGVESLLSTSLFVVGPVDFTPAKLGGVLIVLALTIVNVLGARLSTWFQILFTGIPIVLLVGGSAWAMVAAPEPAVAAAENSDVSARGIAASLAAVYFAYAGWNGVAYVAGEVQRPGRNLPIGLIGGTVIITAVYLTACFAFLSVLGLDGVRTAFEVGSASAAVLGGDGARTIVAALIAIALLGSLNATVLGGGRIAYAMGEDGTLPDWFAHRNRFGVPNRALWLQAGVACVLILSGTFESLVDMTSIAMMLLAGLAVGGLYILRRNRPDADRPYRATGHPVVPALFIVSATVVVVAKVVGLIDPLDPEATKTDRVLPVVGLLAFVVAWLGHRFTSR